MTKNIEVLVPDIGDFSDVPVIEVLVTTGDHIDEGDILVVLESDKSTLEVPSEIAGTVVAVNVKVDQRISEGSLLLTLTPTTTAPVPAGRQVNQPEAPITPQPPVMPEQSVSAPPPTTGNTRHIYASPSVRRYARQLGVDITVVKGSGNKNRITRMDIESFVKEKITAPMPSPMADLPDWPTVDYAKFGPIERVPLSRIAKISGPSLTRNAMLIPHVTHFDKADVTDLENFRTQLNTEAAGGDAKVTLLTFAVKAAVAALKTYPMFNSSLDGDELVTKRYWNIGVAANTAEGLLVPVIKSADTKGYRNIAAEISTLAEAARDGRLAPTDMQGATFTISSLGGVGGTNFTPIINAPQVAILGLPRAEIQPVWDGSAFQPRLIQPLSLSFDHRVIDGVAGALFLGHIASLLTDLRRISV